MLNKKNLAHWFVWLVGLSVQPKLSGVDADGHDAEAVPVGQGHSQTQAAVRESVAQVAASRMVVHSDAQVGSGLRRIVERCLCTIVPIVKYSTHNY